MVRDYTLDFAAPRLRLARVTSPFRDELETVRQENERLRAELARSRPPRPWLALSFAGVDVGAAMALRPWLNGGSDGHFWGALVILFAITLAPGVAAVG